MSNSRPSAPSGTLTWAEGYTARLSGHERQDNPYLDEADAREDQLDNGWLFADAEIARGVLSAAPCALATRAAMLHF